MIGRKLAVGFLVLSLKFGGKMKKIGGVQTLRTLAFWMYDCKLFTNIRGVLFSAHWAPQSPLSEQMQY